MRVSSASRSPPRQRTNNSVTALDGSRCKLNAPTADRNAGWPRRISGIQARVNSLKTGCLTLGSRVRQRFSPLDGLLVIAKLSLVAHESQSKQNFDRS